MQLLKPVTDPPRHKVVVLNQEAEAGLALGRKNVQVLDSERGVVQVFTPGGDHVKSMRWDFDPERGRNFAADGRFELVMAFDENGAPLGAFDQSGSGPGEMQRWPTCAWTPPDTSTSWIHRTRKFSCSVERRRRFRLPRAQQHFGRM